MKLRAIDCVAFGLLCLGVSFAIASDPSAQAPETKISPKATLELHLSLRLDETGQPKLFLNMPVSEEFLRLLISGQEKHPAVFLSTAKGIPYGEVVKAIDMLNALELHKISLDTKR